MRNNALPEPSTAPLDSKVDSKTAPPVTLLAFGGGIDSTAILAAYANPSAAACLTGTAEETVRRVLRGQALKGVAFADPGAEFPETYENVATARRLCAEHNLAFECVHKTDRDGRRLRIQDWLLANGTVPLLPGGRHVCSLKFKGQQLQKWAGRTFPGRRINWLIGIEAGEVHRSKRFQPSPDARQTSSYPLVDLGWDRKACEAVVEGLWPHKVRKSSCMFCPFMSAPEILSLFQDYPAAGELALEIEDRFRKTSPIKHQAWLDAGRPVDKAGRARRGMWRKDAYAEGARLFTKTISGHRPTAAEWQALALDAREKKPALDAREAQPALDARALSA